MAAKLSDKMLRTLLEALVNRRTDDGRFETFGPIRTVLALEARGLVEREEYRDNNGATVTRFYLTARAVTLLRNGFVLMMGNPESKGAEWHRAAVRAEYRIALAAARLILGDITGTKNVTTTAHSIHPHTDHLSADDAVSYLANVLSNGQRADEHGTGPDGDQPAERITVHLGGGVGAVVDMYLNRPAVEEAPALPFRTITRDTTARTFDPLDLHVERCERCGAVGFLARDWDDAQVPALCIECHESGGTQQADNDHQCEDWCGLRTDHDGLCAPGDDAAEEAPEAKACEGCGAAPGEPCTELSMCTADHPAEERGMPKGPHRIVNTGEEIEHTAGDGGKYGVAAFECTRCRKRAILADFEYGRAGECTEDAEAEDARERAEALLNDVTFKGATAYRVEVPTDDSGATVTYTHERDTTVRFVAALLGLGATHGWYRDGLRLTRDGIVHKVSPHIPADDTDARRALMEAGHAQLGALAERHAASCDAEEARLRAQGERDRAASLGARFMPQDPADEDTRPCVELPTGEQVYVYRKGGRLVVSVDLDTATTVRDDGTVPMVITVGGNTVFEG